MQETFERAKAFFARSGVFVCEPCEADNGTFDAGIRHILGESASSADITTLEKTIGRSLTPSHRQLLLTWNGAVLFTQYKPVKQTVGVSFYKSTELPEAHATVVAQNEEALRELLHDPDPAVVKSIQDDLENWLPNLLVIGEELMSDNYIVLDYNQASADGECPVVFLDHELTFMGSQDREVIASSVADFFDKIMTNPVGFLNDTLSCITRYEDGKTEEQWIPADFRMNG